MKSYLLALLMLAAPLLAQDHDPAVPLKEAPAVSQAEPVKQLAHIAEIEIKIVQAIGIGDRTIHLR